MFEVKASHGKLKKEAWIPRMGFKGKKKNSGRTEGQERLLSSWVDKVLWGRRKQNKIQNKTQNTDWQ